MMHETMRPSIPSVPNLKKIEADFRKKQKIKSKEIKGKKSSFMREEKMRPKEEEIE